MICYTDFGTKPLELRAPSSEIEYLGPGSRDIRLGGLLSSGVCIAWIAHSLLYRQEHRDGIENAGMTVFVVIPVFNRLAKTRKVIGQLRSQTCRETKIVVVDDGSTDGTGEYLAAQDDVLMLRGTGNLWWAGSTQLALDRILPAAMETDYVLLLNNDTSFAPDYITTLVETSREHEGAIVGSILRDVYSPHELLSIGPVCDLWKLKTWDRLEQLSEGEKNNTSDVYEINALSGRGALYPVCVLRAIGGLRSRLLPHYYADYELAHRAKRRGFKTLVSSRAVIFAERDFGVNRSEKLWWKRRLGRGSPQNIIHKTIFFMLVGTPFQRATAPIRVLLHGIIRIYAQLPDSVRRVIRGLWLMMQAPFSRLARQRLKRHLPWRPKPGYGALHAHVAASYLNVKRAQVLVVGCNTGEDCRHFVDVGAGRVDGLDVIKEIGEAFRHRRVRYLRMSAELMGLQSNSYDLVFSFATMEHVSDIYSAFREMVRVMRPGGILYCVASPLWNSRHGHHKGEMFQDYPWIHLRLTEQGILAYCERNGISDPSGRLPISEHVAYMLNPKFFNKSPASRYVEVCNSLRNMQAVINDLALDPDEVLTPEICTELEPKGYTRTELLAVTHTYVGEKSPNS